MRRTRRVLTGGWIAALLLVSTVGCQTTRSWSDGCPGVYSGVRYFASQRDTLPWDGKVFFTLDLPLTAVFDTLLLPASSFVDREKPQSGWVPGCRWAD
ncbi:MAG: YceK/YidQ family lipoprotein [Deltaproteobacteria bacterium]|nr:YceK/YidQ family lipoprotein [Deltaproteobacteria bacterium]MBW2541520.1 YceK/YidQ family lipoprotein [Deltaproteobacteria bacterium]